RPRAEVPERGVHLGPLARVQVEVRGPILGRRLVVCRHVRPPNLRHGSRPGLTAGRALPPAPAPSSGAAGQPGRVAALRRPSPPATRRRRPSPRRHRSGRPAPPPPAPPRLGTDPRPP